MSARSPDHETRYILGRPLLPGFSAGFVELEHPVEQVQRLCLERLTTGGCLIIAADWLSEADLYHVLAIASSRLRRLGKETEFRGIPFAGVKLCGPSAPVSFVLDASLRPLNADWFRPLPGRMIVLAGLLNDWQARGVEPEIRLAASAPGCTYDIHFQRAICEWKSAYAAGSVVLREALLTGAAGCDWPAEPATSNILRPVLDIVGEPTGHYATQGSFLLLHALRGLFQDQPHLLPPVEEIIRRVSARFPGEKQLPDRLRYALRLRPLDAIPNSPPSPPLTGLPEIV